MIDPANITRFDCDDRYLEEVAFFFIAAAGKSGTTAARIMNNAVFKPALQDQILPSRYILTFYGRYPTFSDVLFRHGLGCYRMKASTMTELAIQLKCGLPLRTCSPERLEEIRGIGPKTSRGIILHTRRGARYACLDRHALSFLREQGISAPKMTPSNSRLYRKLEQEFLAICDKRKQTPAELDLQIWNERKVKQHG